MSQDLLTLRVNRGSYRSLGRWIKMTSLLRHTPMSYRVKHLAQTPHSDHPWAFESVQPSPLQPTQHLRPHPPALPSYSVPRWAGRCLSWGLFRTSRDEVRAFEISPATALSNCLRTRGLVQRDRLGGVKRLGCTYSLVELAFGLRISCANRSTDAVDVADGSAASARVAIGYGSTHCRYPPGSAEWFSEWQHTQRSGEKTRKMHYIFSTCHVLNRVIRFSRRGSAFSLLTMVAKKRMCTISYFPKYRCGNGLNASCVIKFTLVAHHAPGGYWADEISKPSIWAEGERSLATSSGQSLFYVKDNVSIFRL